MNGMHFYRRSHSERLSKLSSSVNRGGSGNLVSAMQSDDVEKGHNDRLKYASRNASHDEEHDKAPLEAPAMETTAHATNSSNVSTTSNPSYAGVGSATTKDAALPAEPCEGKNDRFSCREWWRQWSSQWMHSHWPIFWLSLLIFGILSAAGISLFLVIEGNEENDMKEDIRDLALETGEWFAKELDLAILPLFSMAQFASELEIFADLADLVKATPTLPPPPNVTNYLTKRNVTGVCDQPDVVERFSSIASAVKSNAKMDGVLHNIQLAPHGVICLLHPINNTEDFDDGKSYLDNTGAIGIDLLNDSFHRYIARESMKHEEMGIVGPRSLIQCPRFLCGLYFIVRLPVVSRTHVIQLDGEEYKRWGFATALINWDALVERSGVHERFKESGLEFQLTRTDHNYNEETNSYTDEVVVLSSSEGFGSKPKSVSTSLQTTNNEWVMTIQYDVGNDVEYIIVILASFIIAFFISSLIYVVLVQKQLQAVMQGNTMAEMAKVELERHLTAALAHELRNPLSAIDSALAIMPDDVGDEAKELVISMQSCTVFMSSILNNMLDSRKLEEGKLSLLQNPFSLTELLRDVHRMMLPAVNRKVKLVVDTTGVPLGRDFVYGDVHRLQQVMTNLVSNSIKFTLTGSITISASWVAPHDEKSTSDHHHARDFSSFRKRKVPKNGGGPAKQYNSFGKQNKTTLEGDDTEMWVQLMCSDTGPGIPKEEQAEMFNRFTTRGGAPGSGLGLSIARQIVDLMGGSIRFESDPTVKPGTDCIVLLPLQLCKVPTSKRFGGMPMDNSVAFSTSASSVTPSTSDGISAATLAPSLGTPGNTNAELSPEISSKPIEDAAPLQESLNILLVDDIKMNRIMLKRRINKCIAPNATISEAATGEEALEICEGRVFDIIVMDQYMQEAGGVMVGTDAVIALRRSKVTSIIVGCSGNDIDDKFMAAGTDVVWKKPMPPNPDIVRQFRRLLNEKKQSLLPL